MKKLFVQLKECLNAVVVVAALGYFVDLFDITLFGVVRVASLKGIGITSPEEILQKGIELYNIQMLGMMVGGLFWGVLADKKGRLSIMLASILMYSLGNIANAFVSTYEAYAICRFLTGVGLAGELGAAVTLVAESLPPELRGLGTTIIATMGLLGSVAAAFFSKFVSWQTAYFVGGAMGILLLLARIKTSESELFNKLENKSSFLSDLKLFMKADLLKRYFACILVGAPIYFITGILFTFSPEIAAGIGLKKDFSAADAILFGTIGLTVGDLASGLLSQWLRSRKRSILISLLLAFTLMLFYISFPHTNSMSLYIICFLLGLSAGYWAVLITTAAEQFGTNIRATAATSIPNFVRGSAVFATSLFAVLKSSGFSIQMAVLSVGCLWFSLAFLGLWLLRESFGVNLDYREG